MKKSNEAKLADLIDGCIQDKKPKTAIQLKKILARLKSESYKAFTYKIKPVFYQGYFQGLRVEIDIFGKKFIRPKGKMVYSIFKGVKR